MNTWKVLYFASLAWEMALFAGAVYFLLAGLKFYRFAARITAKADLTAIVKANNWLAKKTQTGHPALRALAALGLQFLMSLVYTKAVEIGGQQLRWQQKNVTFASKKSGQMKKSVPSVQPTLKPSKQT